MNEIWKLKYIHLLKTEWAIDEVQSVEEKWNRLKVGSVTTGKDVCVAMKCEKTQGAPWLSDRVRETPRKKIMPGGSCFNDRTVNEKEKWKVLYKRTVYTLNLINLRI